MSEALHPRGIQAILRALQTGTTDHLVRQRPAPPVRPPSQPTSADRLAAQLSVGYWRSLAEAARRAGIGYVEAAEISKTDRRFRRRTDPVHDRVSLTLRAGHR